MIENSQLYRLNTFELNGDSIIEADRIKPDPENGKFLRFYFPPDFYGKDIIGSVLSKLDNDDCCDIFDKIEYFENIANRQLFPWLCSKGLKIQILTSGRKQERMIKVFGERDRIISNLEVSVEIGDGPSPDKIYFKGKEYSTLPIHGLNFSYFKDGNGFSIQKIGKNETCKFALKFDYEGTNRSLEIYFYVSSIPVRLLGNYRSSIRLIGEKPTKFLRKDKVYKINKEKFILEEKLVNGDYKEMPFEEPDDFTSLEGNNYIKVYPTTFSSGEQEITENFYFLNVEGKRLIFSSLIETKSEMETFIKSCSANRSKLKCDGGRKSRELDLDNTVSKSIHFEIRNIGDVIRRNWQFLTPDKRIEIFFFGSINRNRNMRYKEVRENWQIPVNEDWNGIFYIVAGRYVFEFRDQGTE